MALVRLFENNNLNMTRLNYVMLTLIPKEENASEIRKFRPIALINCSFKIFSKALNNRLTRIIDRLISPNQTAFIKGRYILESIVAAHEIIHEVARKKEAGIILKIDYEKAYDTVNWNFLLEVLKSRCFSAKWINWITSLTQGGSVCVRLNDENGQCGRCLPLLRPRYASELPIARSLVHAGRAGNAPVPNEVQQLRSSPGGGQPAQQWHGRDSRPVRSG